MVEVDIGRENSSVASLVMRAWLEDLVDTSVLERVRTSDCDHELYTVRFRTGDVWM